MKEASDTTDTRFVIFSSVMKVLLFLFIFCSLSIHYSSTAAAKSLTVDKDGKVVWSVLSYEATTTLTNDPDTPVEVTKINDDAAPRDARISLRKDNGSVNLSVDSGKESKSLAIDGEDNEIVEMEERPQFSKLLIGYQNDKFRIEQKGIVAFTDKPLKIDAINARLKIDTSKGEEYLAVLPFEAVEAVLRTKILTRAAGSNIEISEYDGELKYKIEGNKIFNIFNVYDYSVPVTAYVSPANGELLSIDSPGWYKYVSFLLI